MTDISPVTLEVVRNALIAGAEEMTATIWRTTSTKGPPGVLRCDRGILRDASEVPGIGRSLSPVRKSTSPPAQNARPAPHSSIARTSSLSRSA